MRGNQLIYRKMSISRLLWDGRWKLHREIQRHAIVTTYKFMTNDRCEDSFVFNMFQMTSITVYLQRTSDRSNSHERRCSNRNLDDMHAIWGIYAICVFVWKRGPRPRTSSRCYHGNKSVAPFKKSIFVHPPRAPNCMQNLKGGWKFSFFKMLDSYRLVINNSYIRGERCEHSSNFPPNICI